MEVHGTVVHVNHMSVVIVIGSQVQCGSAVEKNAIDDKGAETARLEVCGAPDSLLGCSALMQLLPWRA